MFSSSSYRGRQTARKIDTELTETRVQALSKSNAWMQIVYDSGTKRYVLKTSYGEDQDLGGTITICYTKDGESTETKITDDGSGAVSLALSYDRATGGFLPMLTAVTSTGYTAGTEYCSKITVYCGKNVTGSDAKCFEISLAKNTGRHTLVD
jgi:hypothetical protein